MYQSMKDPRFPEIECLRVRPDLNVQGRLGRMGASQPQALPFITTALRFLIYSAEPDDAACIHSHHRVS